MEDFEYCCECPFYDKKNEIEYIKKVDYGNGIYDTFFEWEAPCLKYGHKTVPMRKCKENENENELLYQE